MKTEPTLETFLSWPTEKVAEVVRADGPKVCVFPINGTRRWFMLEYPPDSEEEFAGSYLDIMTRRHIELYKLCFDHGIDTLLTPIFGPDLLERGEEYVALAVEGMARLGTHADFLDFYREYKVRVRFYGDYRKFLEPTPHHALADIFDNATQRTRNHKRYRLFFGVFAHDAVETLAELAIAFYREHGRIPEKRTLVELYYGEYVEPVDFFIGFDKFSAFDMPLVATGEEDLYFTVAPSPYLTEKQLRTILYDHIYVRPEGDTEYAELTPDDWSLMRSFYQANLEKTQGVGARTKGGGFWYPLPQVELPEAFKDAC
ncbi:MAG: diterpene synthase [Anaerolineae bacterium]